jgi:hypothetical protein
MIGILASQADGLNRQRCKPLGGATRLDTLHLKILCILFLEHNSNVADVHYPFQWFGNLDDLD